MKSHHNVFSGEQAASHETLWTSYLGFGKRMRAYLAEMYPLLPNALRAGLIVLGFWSIVAGIHGVRLELMSGFSSIGLWSVFSLLLILRVMDELKDKEIDRELFSHRALPAGRVRESDLVVSLVILVTVYVIVNAFSGLAFWAALGVLGYAFLMFAYFFMPDLLRRNLLLNLLTHNPVIPIALYYLAMALFESHGVALDRVKWGQTSLAVLMVWAPLFAWEIARKIRSVEEETAYVTYSQILGRMGAVALAGGAQILAFGLGVVLCFAGYLSLVFLAVLGAALILVLYGHVRFLLRPGPMTSGLKSFAELYALALFAGGILDHTFTRAL